MRWSVTCLKLTSSHPFHWICSGLHGCSGQDSAALPHCGHTLALVNFVSHISPLHNCNTLLTSLPAASLATFQPMIQSEARVFLCFKNINHITFLYEMLKSCCTGLPSAVATSSLYLSNFPHSETYHFKVDRKKKIAFPNCLALGDRCTTWSSPIKTLVKDTVWGLNNIRKSSTQWLITDKYSSGKAWFSESKCRRISGI